MVVSLKKTSFLFLFIVFLILAILFSISSCSDEQKNYFTEKNNGENINLNEGDIINVRLESNITTGYSWELSGETDPDIIMLESSTYEELQKDKNVTGAGGSEIFFFKAVSAGKTDIVLEYLRPWEEDVQPVDIFVIKVTVE